MTFYYHEVNWNSLMNIIEEKQQRCPASSFSSSETDTVWVKTRSFQSLRWFFPFMSCHKGGAWAAACLSFIELQLSFNNLAHNDFLHFNNIRSLFVLYICRQQRMGCTKIPNKVLYQGDHEVVPLRIFPLYFTLSVIHCVEALQISISIHS